jgi:aryl-alcohol dehydrogenase-like predicted oxidoreductase
MVEDTKFNGDDIRKDDPKFSPPRYGQYLSAVGQLDALARDHYGKTVLALAVRWLLDKGNLIALWGARHPGQLEPIEEITGWRIDPADMEAIDRILSSAIKDPVGPEFMAPALT